MYPMALSRTTFLRNLRASSKFLSVFLFMCARKIALQREKALPTTGARRFSFALTVAAVYGAGFQQPRPPFLILWCGEQKKTPRSEGPKTFLFPNPKQKKRNDT